MDKQRIDAEDIFGLALLALGTLMFWKLPPWLVVLASGLLGSLSGAWGA